jgi:hypothetical protein
MPRRRTHPLVLIGSAIGLITSLIIGLVFGPLLPWPEAAAAQASGSAPVPGDAVIIHGGDAATASLIHRSVARFEQIGLALPALEFFVHDGGLTACEGHRGYWRHRPDRDRIDICVPGESLMLHELAHAWDHHAVDDASRDAFMALYPDEAWVDQSAAHEAQGIERFADAVTWGLEFRSDETGIVMSRHGAEVRQHNIDTFVLITGAEPPRLTDPTGSARAGRRRGGDETLMACSGDEGSRRRPSPRS